MSAPGQKAVCLLLIFIMAVPAGCAARGSDRSEAVMPDGGKPREVGDGWQETGGEPQDAGKVPLGTGTATQETSGEPQETGGNAADVGSPSNVQADGPEAGNKGGITENGSGAENIGGAACDFSRPEEMLKHIKENIGKIPGDEAAKLLLGLERLQEDHLEDMANRYYDNNVDWSGLDGAYDHNTGEINMDLVKSRHLRKLLTDAQNNGYRTASAEGWFFPVIDYGIYIEFCEKLPEDLRNYFSLMAAESGRAPADDGGLVIGWDEVINRALAQQRFIMDYGYSQKVEKIKELYRTYVVFIFSGDNIPNTPHFSYDRKTLSPRLKESLIEIAGKNGTTPLEKMVGDYVKILDKNKYKLTEEVKRFRENAVVSLCG